MRPWWGFSVAGALIFAASASAQTFDQVIVFGDSTVDNGTYYRKLANPNNNANAAQTDAWKAAVETGAGAPTSNPGFMYPGTLATRLGIAAASTGQNWATSGAKVNTANDNNTGGFRAAFPVTRQVLNYFADVNGGPDNPVANPNALYIISAGGNDVAYALGKTGNAPPPDPNAHLQEAARSLAFDVVGALHGKGARYFVVAYLPNSFPMGSSADAQAERDARTYFNSQLHSWLGELNVGSDGPAIITADINSLRLAIAQNPASYGFQFVDNAPNHTACAMPDAATYPFAQIGWALWCSPASPVSQLISGADRNRLFADDQHLATAGQEIEADYIYNLITPILAPKGGK